MQIRVLGAVITAGLAVVTFHTSVLAADNVGIDRIYAAEAKTAAYQAENERLKEAVATQAAALKRLDHQLQERVDTEAAHERLRQSAIALAEQQARESQISLSRQLQAQQAQHDEQIKAMRLREQETLRQLDQLQAAHAQSQAGTSQQVVAAQQQADAARAAAEAAQAESDRTKAQLSFVMERNVALQTAVSNANRQDVDGLKQELMQLKQDKAALSSELQSTQSALATLRANASTETQTTAQLQNEIVRLRESNLALQAGAESAQGSRNSLAGLHAENLDLKRDTAALLDSLQACESGGVAAPAPVVMPACPDMSAENARLQAALAAANAGVENCKAQAAEDLNIERTLHARSEAALEKQLQADLQACQKKR